MLLKKQRFALKDQSVKNSLNGEIELLKELCISLISNRQDLGKDLDPRPRSSCTKYRVNHYHKHF